MVRWKYIEKYENIHTYSSYIALLKDAFYLEQFKIRPSSGITGKLLLINATVNTWLWEKGYLVITTTVSNDLNNKSCSMLYIFKQVAFIDLSKRGMMSYLKTAAFH